MYIQYCLLQEMNDAKKKKKALATNKLSKPKHTCKRKQWTEESMIAAMEAVSGSSVSRAALEHNMPRITLQDRHLGRVGMEINQYLRSYLRKNEEKELDFIEVVSSVGYGRTRYQVMNIAESVARVFCRKRR